MATQFKTPEEVAEEYLTELKTLKPTVNRDQQDSDWWIRSRVVGGVVSGIYADQRLIANDAFPQRARRDALGRHLDTYLNDTFKPATQSNGYVVATGTPGTTIPALTQLTYDPKENNYQVTEDTDIGVSGNALVPVQSILQGQSQNLLSGAVLSFSSPPDGIDGEATASGDISSGRNVESDAEAAARVLEFIRNPNAGGTESDYRKWALQADDRVVDAAVVRHMNGLGTVGVVITAGTTDIDEALDNGDDVSFSPSEELLEIVHDYIDALNPVNDKLDVIGPEEVEIDVTVHVRFAQGDLNTILSGQTLTQEELVQREVQRAIYKTPTGGRKFDGVGYVVASEIEETIDQSLSSTPYVTGDIEMLVDRAVVDLSETGRNIEVEDDARPIPGAITVVEMEGDA